MAKKQRKKEVAKEAPAEPAAPKHHIRVTIAKGDVRDYSITAASRFEALEWGEKQQAAIGGKSVELLDK